MSHSSGVNFALDRRAFIAGVSSLAGTALAGCSGAGDGGEEPGGDGGATDEADSDPLTITNTRLDQNGGVTTSTLTVENSGDQELNPTVSATVGIGPDGLYGRYSDEQRTTVAGGETADITLDLFDGTELSDVALEEVHNGFVTLAYFIDGVERSNQELGERSATYVSFKVRYDGSWQGSLGTESGQRSISGRGARHLPVENSARIVSGNAQKRDSGSGTLTVQSLVDGSVVTEQSTTAQYGVAQVSETV